MESAAASRAACARADTVATALPELGTGTTAPPAAAYAAARAAYASSEACYATPMATLAAVSAAALAVASY